MADPPRNIDSGDDSGVEPDRGATIGTSRWQKVVGIIGLLVVLLVGNQMFGELVGGGPGPAGRHGPGQEAPPEDAPPEGGHG